MTYSSLQQRSEIQYLTGSAIIESPGFSSVGYPNNANCQWRIQADSGYGALRFGIHYFRLEYFNDWVRIYNGFGTDSSQLIAKFTGYLFYLDITTSSYATMHFQSNSGVTDQGFLIYVYSTNEYTQSDTTASPVTTQPMSNSTCGKSSLSGFYGYISSPGYPSYYYGNDLECQWSVETPFGTFIRMSIQSFSLGSGDYLYVYDGDSENNKIIADLEGYVPYNNTIVTSSNFAFLRFTTNSYSVANGFNIRYDAEFYIPPDKLPSQSISCGGTLYENNGTIISPNYPENYQNNVDCIWIIHVPSWYNIVFEVDYFYTEDDFDYVFMYDGTPDQTGPQLAHLTGFYENFNAQIQSSNNSAYIIFHSDKFITAPGFKIQYTSVYYGTSTSATPTETTPMKTTTPWWLRTTDEAGHDKNDVISNIIRRLWERIKNKPIKKRPQETMQKP
ncbi:scavenger receptor cysteine-rich domain-containing protein DMBT1-like [Styela clava]